MAVMPTWLFATAYPGKPLGATLVPVVKLANPQKPQNDPNFKTFYYGMNRWSEQWRDEDTKTRWRWDVPTVPIDPNHRIATLQACVAGTVAAYQTAANVLLGQQSPAERVVYQAIGHGARSDPPNVATADFGCQLGHFADHEFRVAKTTFEVYREILNNGFDVQITTDPAQKTKMTPKQKARHLLAFDGLCAIRRAAQSVVKRIRIVTCNIGSDQDFIEQLAWTLGRPRPGEQAYTKIVVEAYRRQVDARQKDAAAPFRIGIVQDPDKPDDITYSTGPDKPETEYPTLQLVKCDPMSITPDPFGAEPVAMLLGDCHSISSLIPPAVLLT